MKGKDTRHEDAPEHQSKTEFEAQDGARDEGGGDDDANDLDDEFATIVRERNEFRDQWERARADYQNLLQRLPRQVEDGVRRELEPRLNGLVQVLDYLGMALASPAVSPDAKAIAFGVDMVKKLLIDTLSDLGVEQIEAAIGQRLDPTRHEAIASQDVADEPGSPEDGAIVSVEKCGYVWKGRPIRHTQVKVARRTSSDTAND